MLDSIKTSNKSVPVVVVILSLIFILFLLEIYFGGARSEIQSVWQSEQNCSGDCGENVLKEK